MTWYAAFDASCLKVVGAISSGLCQHSRSWILEEIARRRWPSQIDLKDSNGRSSAQDVAATSPGGATMEEARGHDGMVCWMATEKVERDDAIGGN